MTTTLQAVTCLQAYQTKKQQTVVDIVMEDHMSLSPNANSDSDTSSPIEVAEQSHSNRVFDIA